MNRSPAVFWLSRATRFTLALAATCAVCLLAIFGTLSQPSAATVYAAPVAQVAPGDQTLIELYKKVIPSVVSVFVRIPERNAVIQPTPRRGATPTPNPSDPFEPFSRGNGSGFIYSEDGYIITNAHVVEDADKVQVMFYDDLLVTAKVVGVNKDSDIAVLKVESDKINKSRFKPLALADSDKLEIGQRVVAIGNPFTYYPGTLTEGIVSGINRRFDSQVAQFQIPGMIQTDAAINPGNSGGPLVDMSGAVIGINTAIESNVRQSSGVGFAVPSNLIARFAPRLIKDGVVKHSYLGIRGGDLTSDLSEALGLSIEQQGVIVTEVVRAGPAAAAGIKGTSGTKVVDGEEIPLGGDIIVGVDDVQVRKFEQLLGYLFTKTDPGQTVTLKILRDGQPLEVKVTLAERPSS